MSLLRHAMFIFSRHSLEQADQSGNKRNDNQQIKQAESPTLLGDPLTFAHQIDETRRRNNPARKSADLIHNLRPRRVDYHHLIISLVPSPLTGKVREG